MRTALLLSLAILKLPTYAAEMLPVPSSEAYCGNTDAYCYEWRFVRDPSLRFVATGYEDGGGFYFYRRNAQGDYKMLFAVYPAMIDARHPGTMFWGYAWDIKDIVLSGRRDSAEIQVAFDHRHEDDGNWSPPEGQQRVPYVLFTGTTTQPEFMVRERLRFSRLSIESARRRAMANQSLEPTRVGKPPLAAQLQR